MSAPHLAKEPYLQNDALLPYDYMISTAAFGGIAFTLWSIAAVTTLLRLYTRGVVLNYLGLDDYLALLGTALSLAVTCLAYFATKEYNTIYFASFYKDAPQWMPFIRQWDLGFRCDGIMEYVYNLALPCIKCSILAFFLRVSVLSTKRTRIALWVFMAAIALHGILNFAFTIAGYTPTEVVWHYASYYNAHPEDDLFQYEPDKIQLANSILQFVYDLIILAIPVPFLIRLKVMRHKKSLAPIGIVIVYFLSFVTIAISIIRLIQCIDFEYIDDAEQSNANPFYTFIARVMYLLWTVIELNTVILVANLPAIYALWKRHRDNGRQPSTGTAGYFVFSRFAPHSWRNANRHRPDGEAATRQDKDADMEKALGHSNMGLGPDQSTTKSGTQQTTSDFTITHAKSDTGSSSPPRTYA